MTKIHQLSSSNGSHIQIVSANRKTNSETWNGNINVSGTAMGNSEVLPMYLRDRRFVDGMVVGSFM